MYAFNSAHVKCAVLIKYFIQVASSTDPRCDWNRILFIWVASNWLRRRISHSPKWLIRFGAFEIPHLNLALDQFASQFHFHTFSGIVEKSLRPIQLAQNHDSYQVI